MWARASMLGEKQACPRALAGCKCSISGGWVGGMTMLCVLAIKQIEMVASNNINMSISRAYLKYPFIKNFSIRHSPVSSTQKWIGICFPQQYSGSFCPHFSACVSSWSFSQRVSLIEGVQEIILAKRCALKDCERHCLDTDAKLRSWG